MPVILAPGDYAHWLREEPDPRDVMRPFPAELMRMWPISTWGNKPENDHPSILESVELAVGPSEEPIRRSIVHLLGSGVI